VWKTPAEKMITDYKEGEGYKDYKEVDAISEVMYDV
jgi:hypothetical protein